jgi:hypothetical protein
MSRFGRKADSDFKGAEGRSLTQLGHSKNENDGSEELPSLTGSHFIECAYHHL